MRAQLVIVRESRCIFARRSEIRRSRLLFCEFEPRSIAARPSPAVKQILKIVMLLLCGPKCGDMLVK